MSIALVADANEIVGRLVFQKETQAYYKSVQERVEKGFVTAFVTDLQNLVVKVALIISEVAVSVKLKTGYYLTSIDYLCNKVLKDNDLHKGLRATKINENANKNKHTLEATADEINIGQCISQYNRLINQLIKKLEVPALNVLRITAQVGSVKNTSKSIANQPKANKATLVKIKKVATVKPKTSEIVVVKSNKNSSTQKNIPNKEENKTVKKPDKSAFTLNDAVGTLRAEILPGKGKITKHSLFGKDKKVLDCILKVDYDGKYDLKNLKASIALATSGKEDVNIQLGNNNLELELQKYQFPELRITVTATVKLGFMSSKELKCTVSRNF